MSRILALSLVALIACTSGESDDPIDSADTADTAVETTGQTTAVVTTVSSDSTTGSFATVSLDDWTVSNDLFVTTGDASVSVDDGKVFQVNRLGYDTVRMYTPGEWTEPVWEKELTDLSNPGPADVCAGSLFVALYGTSTLGVYDPATGNLTGTVDLSAYGDGDGVGPEPSSLVEVDGKLYVGLNRLDRENGWIDAGGAVVEVDCDSKAATQSWDVGGNTTVHAWEGTDHLLVLGRAYGDDTGGIYKLDPSTGVTHVAAVAGEEFAGIVASGDHAVAISLASDYSHYALHCVNLATDTVTSSTNSPQYYSGISANDRGEAWVVSSPSWIDDTAPVGLSVYDIASCDAKTTAPIALSLAPKTVAFY
ncbi:MAG: hypothetical protein KC912_24715 [Proteobacteria bacterium]|nr:hypothetical protein [Pseudomonadota bacterium]